MDGAQDRQAAPVLGPDRTRAVADYAWALPTQPGASVLLDLLTP